MITGECLSVKTRDNGVLAVFRDVVYVKMRYPMYRGMTEIKAFLRNEGSLICEDCYER